MKYFKAVLYALLMMILFFSTLVFVDGVTKAQRLIDIIENAFDDENYNILLRGRYQSETPLFEGTLKTADFEIDFLAYETAEVVDEKIKHNVEIIVLGKSGEMSLFTDVETSLIVNGEVVELWLVKYLNMEVYTVVMDNDYNNLLTVEELFENGDNIEAFKVGYTPKDGEFTETISSINFNKEDLTLIDKLDSYLAQNNNNYPTEDTNEIKLSQEIKIDTRVTMIITAVITLTLITSLTLYVYVFRPRRKMGKKELTHNLEKDIEKLNQPKE